MEKFEGRYVITASPHIRSRDTSRSIMLNVIIALVPALVASVIIFGLRALLVEAVTVASCVLCEVVWCAIRKEKHTAGDLTAVITGLLLSFNMPASIPLYVPVIGAIVAIIVVKEMFGGLGRNFANPAIVARIFLAVAFPVAMTTFAAPLISLSPVDVVSSATPLAPAAQPLSYAELLLGAHMGVLGETSAIALLLGMVFLLVRPVITWHTPVAYVGTVCVLSLLVGKDPVAQVLSGGLLLGAIYMATDYTTSPATKRGKLVFGIGCGLITCLIRFWGNLNEGVAYSILFMNLLVPYIDQLTPNIPVGGEQIMAERRRMKRGGKADE